MRPVPPRTLEVPIVGMRNGGSPLSITPPKKGARPAPGLPPPGPLGFEWRGGELPRDVAPPYWLGRGDDIMFVAAVVERGGRSVSLRGGSARHG